MSASEPFEYSLPFTRGLFKDVGRSDQVDELDLVVQHPDTITSNNANAVTTPVRQYDRYPSHEENSSSFP